MNPRLARALALALAGGAFAPAASAQTAPTAASLDTVTVHGQASAGADKPNTIESVTAKQIREDINVVNTEDAVKYLPGLAVRKRYIGDRNAIVNTRTAGTTMSARSLLYADDLLLSNLLGNNYSYPPRWGIVSPEEIDRIDVLYGPYAAEYPGNSAGAVLVMRTRLPQRFETHASVQGFAQDYGYAGHSGSYGGSKLDAALGNRNGDLSWLLALGRLDSRGQPMQFATLPASTSSTAGKTVTGAATDTDTSGKPRTLLGATAVDHTEQHNLNLKLAYDFSPTLRAQWTLAGWRNVSDTTTQSWLRDSAGNTVSTGVVNLGGKNYALNNVFNAGQRIEEHWLNALSLRGRAGADLDWTASASVYNIGHDEDRSSLPDGSTAGGRSWTGQRTDRANGKGWRTADLKLVWRASPAHELSAGAHHDRYTLDAKTWFTSSGDASWLSADAGLLSSASTGKTRTNALYLQDSWRFAPDWKLIAGLRHEDWQASDGSNTRLASGVATTQRYASVDRGAWSPKLALAHELDAAWTLRGAFGRATRFATVTELYQTATLTDASGKTQTTLQNDPNLRPERTGSIELSAERASDGGALRLSLFAEHVSDSIYSQKNLSVTPNYTAYQNVDEVHTRGVETAWQQRDAGLAGLDLQASATFADATIRENAANPAYVGKRFPGVPRWRATALAGWRHSDALGGSLGLRYSGRQYSSLDNSDSNDRTYGGRSRYLFVDARVNWHVTQEWTASLGVDNLFNDRAWAYHPYPLRTVYARLRYDL